MYRCLNVFLVWPLLAGAVMAHAGEPAPLALDWPACLQEARSGNPDLRAAGAALAASAASELASRGQRLPQVSAGLGYSRSGSDDADSPDDSTSEGYDASLSAQQLLFSGGRVAATLEQRRAEVEQARAALRRTELEVAFDLKSAFAGLLYAQQSERLARQILERRDENLRLVSLRFEGGREHKGSMMRIKAAAREARFDVSRSERARVVAQRVLARALGRAESTGLQATGDYPVPAPETAPDFEELTRTSPLQDQADARRRVASAAVRRARSSFFPELSASGSLNRDGDQFFPEDERWAVGVSLDIPLFEGGTRRHELAAARAQEEQAQAELLGTEYDVRRELEQAHASLMDDSENLGVRQEFLEAAQVRAEIARSQYTSGLLSFEDWDLIENDLINTEKSLLAARRDAVLSEATWELAAGKDAFHAQ